MKRVEVLKSGDAHPHFPITMEILQKVKGDIQNKIDEHQCLGEFVQGGRWGHNYADIKLSNVSHRIDRVYIEEETLFADVTILQVERGNDLAEFLLNSGAYKVLPRIYLQEFREAFAYDHTITIDFHA